MTDEFKEDLKALAFVLACLGAGAAAAVVWFRLWIHFLGEDAGFLAAALPIAYGVIVALVVGEGNPKPTLKKFAVVYVGFAALLAAVGGTLIGAVAGTIWLMSMLGV